MSSTQIAPEHICYVHCNFCNTILAVSVPGSRLFNIVTVRCGHCANLLTVHMGSLLQSHHSLQDFQGYNMESHGINKRMEYGSSSKTSLMYSTETDQVQMLPVRPPEKRQRVPSAYNRFIREEIQRIKTSNPSITHKEAFSTAAKNWAHFPRIHIGVDDNNNNNNSNNNNNKQLRMEGGAKGSELMMKDVNLE